MPRAPKWGLFGCFGAGDRNWQATVANVYGFIENRCKTIGLLVLYQRTKFISGSCPIAVPMEYK